MRKLAVMLVLTALLGGPTACSIAAKSETPHRKPGPGAPASDENGRVKRVMKDIKPLLEKDKIARAVERVNRAIERTESEAALFRLRMTNIRVLLAATLQGKMKENMLRRQAAALLEENSGRREERAHLIAGKIYAALGSYDRAGNLLQSYLDEYPEPPAVKVRNYREKTGKNHPRVMYRYLARRMLDKINMVGQQVPDFDVTTLSDETRTPESYTGKVWLLNFWSTDVEACRKELPNLKKMLATHENDFAVLGVNMNQRRKKVTSFVDDNNISWAQAHVGQESILPNRFSVQSLPATFLMDENGTVRAVGLRGKRLRSKVKELVND